MSEYLDKINVAGTDYEVRDPGAYRIPQGGIPSSDLAAGVIPDTSNFITKAVDDLLNYYLKSETYTKAEVQALVAAIQGVTLEYVAELPTASENTMRKIYLVPSSDPQTHNIKDEYITLRSGEEGSYTYAWEQIGSTAIDLSGYVTTSALNTALADYITTAALTLLLAGKQDVIDSSHKLPYPLISGTPNIPIVPDISTNIQTDASSDAKTASPKAVKTYTDGKTGDLSNLTTTAKSNLVEAINEAAASGGAEDAVKYTQQSLTTEQKTQARTNIGAGVNIDTVNVSVDNTSGTPTGSASLNGSTLNIVLTGLKGTTGNSGYQGEQGELEVVNNMTDGGAEKALSAEVGKQFGQDLYFYAEQGTINKNPNGSSWATTYTLRYVKVPKNARILITSGYYYLLKSVDTTVAPIYACGTSGRIDVGSGKTAEVIPYEDCYFCWIYSTYKPTSVLINGFDYVEGNGPTVLKFDKVFSETETIINDYYDLLVQRALDTQIDSGRNWKTGSGRGSSRYVLIPKGITVVVSAPSNAATYCYVVKSINTSASPVFASGTSGLITVTKNTSYTLISTEECYFCWYYSSYKPQSVTIYGNEYVDGGGPAAPMMTRVFSEISASNSRIDDIRGDLDEALETSVYLDKETGFVNKYMSDGYWSPNPGQSRYIKVEAGDLVNVVSNSSQNTQISCVESLTDSVVVYKNGFSGRQVVSAFSAVMTETGYFLVLYEAGTNFKPATLTVNGRSYLDGPDGRTATQWISDEVSEMQQQPDGKYIGNLSKYFLKGKAVKTFTKKIGIIAAGQSNIDGRVPAADMPSAMSAAMPLTNCHHVKNSESGEFVPLNITSGNWAFDAVTYYNLVSRANQEIYVMKWSEGGTSIDPLGDDGSLNHHYWTADYEQLTSNQRSLLRWFENEVRNHVESDGENFEIRALLWHQGESDRASVKTGCELRYLDNLRNVIQYIRGFVGNPNLPVIMGTISKSSGQYDRMVDWSIRKLASEDPYIYLIDMADATLLDSYHFDAASSKYFGEKAYDALIDAGVITGTKINPTAPWED